MKKLFPHIIAHICIIISGMLITFVIIDYVNPIMNFVNNSMTKTLILILSICAIFMAYFIISKSRKEK